MRGLNMKKVKLLALMAITASFFMLSACADDGASTNNNGGNTSTTDPRCENLTGIGYDNANGVWEIYNANGLHAFRDEVNNGDIDLNATLVCDIDLNGDVNNQWTPIIDTENYSPAYLSYNGIFDGGNHTISGMYIDNDSVIGIAISGLFGFVGPNGVVKNVGVTDAYINSGSLDNNTDIVIGTIAALNAGTVISSYAKDISISSTKGNDIGGIAGFNVTNVIATYADNVSFTIADNLSDIGGIIGYNDGDIIASYTNNIAIDTPSTRIGGIAGRSYSSLDTTFFINDDTSLMGIGDFAYNSINAPSNDNATPVDIQGLNDNVNAMNTLLNSFEVANDVQAGYRLQTGADTANDLPTFVEYTLPVDSIELTYPSTNINTAQTLTPNIIYTPANTTQRSVTYISSDPSAVAVDEYTGAITGGLSGNATITATSTDNTSVSYSVDITVIAIPTDPNCVNIPDAGYDNVGGTWEIYNAKGLHAFRDEVNNGDIDLNATLVCDIDLNGDVNNQWTPIIDTENYSPAYLSYNGIFDGGNHTISGMYIDNDSVIGIAISGLFGFVGPNGVVKNVGVTDAYINSGSLDNNTDIVIGTIAALNAGTVISSYAKDISISSTKGNDIGGIAGFNVTNVIATYADNVSFTIADNLSDIGGIIGYNDGDIIASYTNNIAIDTPSTRIGGIAGRSYSSLDTTFFINDDTSLMGIGDFAYNSINAPSNDNATPVDIQGLNDNVNAMNTLLNSFEVTNDVLAGYRLQMGADTANDLPTLYIISVESIELTYLSTSIYSSQTLIPTITYTPANTGQRSVTYISSNPSTAAVDKYTGVITGGLPGNATITATSTDNTSVSYSVDITVNAIPVDPNCVNIPDAGYDNVGGTWEIYNAKGLHAFRDEVNNGDIDLNATLVCDIYLLGDVNNQWTPIAENDGSASYYYSNYDGTFNGDNYTISGIYIDNNTMEGAGLFGYIGDNGIVKNVHVTDSYINAERTIGSITGDNSGLILSSSASNTQLLAANYTTYLGGIAGNNGGSIVATYANNIEISSMATNAYIGGIAGDTGENIVSSYSNNITTTTVNASRTYLGGIAGEANQIDTNFFVNGDVSLMGIGNFRHNNIDAPSNDNATPVDIQGLNDNVNAMNTAIGEFEGANTGITVDMRWQPGVDTATDLPTLRLN